jgi:hypothetical protein
MELLKQTERFETLDKYIKNEQMQNFSQELSRQLEIAYKNTTQKVNWILEILNKGSGISGTFTSAGGKTITVVDGIIISIV